LLDSLLQESSIFQNDPVKAWLAKLS